MADLYLDAFLLLLALYVGYSLWARLDGRLPVAGALILLVLLAVLDASGNTSAANEVAVYVFFLLVAGALLLLVDHYRRPRRIPSSAHRAPGEPAGERSEATNEG